MANFKTHVSVGAFVAFFMTIFSYIWEFTSNFGFSVLVFFTTIIGSFLPDTDSDSGLPIRIIFGIYAFFAAGFMFYVVYNSDLHPAFSAVIPLGAFLIVHYVIQPTFKKYTAHRGIWHSLPAVLITFVGMLYLMDFVNISLMEKFMFAMALATGYLTHLVLDEIYATSFLTSASKKRKGRRKKKFRLVQFKQSFGTALDLSLSKKTWREGILAYLLLGALVYFTYPTLLDIYNELF